MKKTIVILILLASVLILHRAFALVSNPQHTYLSNASTQYWSLADGGTASTTDLVAPFTISFMIRPNQFPGTPYTDYVLFGKTDAGTNQRQYSFNYDDNPAGTTVLRWFTNNAGTNGASNRNATWTYTLVASTTYHIVLDVNSGTDIKLFVNQGAEGYPDAGTWHASPFDGTAAFFIGNSTGGTAFRGGIDDFRIWSRSLGTTSIESLIDAPCDFDNGANLIGWWLFDNNGTDESNNNNTLTNNNSATFESPGLYSCAVASVPSIIGDIIWFWD